MGARSRERWEPVPRPWQLLTFIPQRQFALMVAFIDHPLGRLRWRPQPSLSLLVSAPSHQRYSPAASFHAGLVAPLANPLRAAMRPCLRAGCPLLGRCFVVGHCDQRHAKHRDKNSPKKQTSHRAPRQMVVVHPILYSKTACCEIRC